MRNIFIGACGIFLCYGFSYSHSDCTDEEKIWAIQSRTFTFHAGTIAHNHTLTQSELNGLIKSALDFWSSNINAEIANHGISESVNDNFWNFVLSSGVNAPGSIPVHLSYTAKQGIAKKFVNLKAERDLLEVKANTQLEDLEKSSKIIDSTHSTRNAEIANHKISKSANDNFWNFVLSSGVNAPGSIPVHISYTAKQGIAKKFVNLKAERDLLEVKANTQLEDVEKSSKAIDSTHSTRNADIVRHNKMVEKYNQTVETLNSLSHQMNLITANFQSTEQGIYRGEENQSTKERRNEEIEIFYFFDLDDLQTVIAHEIGHAIGLQHVPREKALMHAYKSAGMELLEADRAEIRRVLRNNSIRQCIPSATDS